MSISNAILRGSYLSCCTLTSFSRNDLDEDRETYRIIKKSTVDPGYILHGKFHRVQNIPIHGIQFTIFKS